MFYGKGGKKKKKTAIYCIVSWPGLKQPVFFIKPVYRPACSTVLLGFLVVCSVEQMLQLGEYPTDQVCSRETSLKKWNFKSNMH